MNLHSCLNLRLPAFLSVRLSVAMLILATWGTGAAAEFDPQHALFGGVLARHVREGRVDYAALKAGRSDLDRYLDQVAGVKRDEYKSWSEPRQLAFLCNAYNAWTLRLIVDHYPVRTIKDIGGFLSGPWSQPVVRLFGGTTTLDHLEHKLIRGEHRDPRIHFALVCAAVGCPPLRNEAYVDVRLGAQLDDQARRFMAARGKNRVDVDAGAVYLSPLFKWYEADFEAKSGTVLSALEPYWPEADRAALAGRKFKIRYTDYDWSLNDIATGAR